LDFDFFALQPILRPISEPERFEFLGYIPRDIKASRVDLCPDFGQNPVCLFV
jgi:hypothetical protein